MHWASYCGPMSLTVLKLRTDDGEHRISCPVQALLDVGSELECEIALDGEDVLPRHCSLRRVGEKRFHIVAAVGEARFTVNGVTGGDLEVDVPFTFKIGADIIEFDLVADDEEQLGVDEEVAESEAGDYMEKPTAAVRPGRRDYLLHPTVVKPRMGQRVAEVIVKTQTEPAEEIQASMTVLEESKQAAEMTAVVAPPLEAEHSSSGLLFTGLVVCGVMVAAIIYWQQHLDLAASEEALEVWAALPAVKELTPEEQIQACEYLRHAGAAQLAVQILMPLAEEGHIEAIRQLGMALHDSGSDSGEVTTLLEQAAQEGCRDALRDLVSVVDDQGNPSRNDAQSFQQLQAAAKLGEVSAWMPLGERYELGLGTEKDVELAIEAYEKAFAAGDMRAEVKLLVKKAASDRVAAFIRSWNEVSVAQMLDNVIPGQGKFFMLDHPEMDVLLRLEEELRERWPLRRISVAAGGTTELEAFHLVKVHQPFQFEVQREERIARGKGLLMCTVQTDEAGRWRITDADDMITLTEMLPSKDKFVVATSLHDLKPAFSHEEQVEQSRLEILRGMRGIDNTQDFKPAITALMNAVYEFPKEVFWKPFADTLCDRLARQLFIDGKWLDVGWVGPVHQLADRGSVSAMLLEGHLLAAGYGFPRDEASSVAMYQKAFESGKRRDARFYYAEALFQGRGVPKDFEKAGALVLSLMSRSKHPLEAYLAAHLLWRKAEIDPSLWQEVYDILARVADRYPPAKNLAGLILLNNGHTTKERRTGFAAIKAAAEAGVVEAMRNLSECYEQGVGCEKDLLMATTWKQKAAVTPPPRRRHYSEFED